MSYLFELADRLAQGVRKVPRERLDRHQSFLLSMQMPDGGFRGREGDSDLYYTGFAVRALSLIDGFDQSCAGRVGDYLGQSQFDRLEVIDLISWMYSALVVQFSGGPDVLSDAPDDWPQQIAEKLETTRTADGGYAKTTEGAAGSTYHSFLVALIYEMIQQPLPYSDRLVQFLFDRQRDDGGFVEIAPMKRSGTNPTAAAAALLKMYDALDAETVEDITGFLGDVWTNEGGFQANTRIPFADGLSSFTGLLTCRDLNITNLADEQRMKTLVETQLEFPTGGFRGAAWDTDADVEYTFYGLGLLGLLYAEE
ncbi:prenyltransferase/squalene oxidase repeat-containing protein [Calycomorphotria hydatis]|uniref:Prenyltransferase and squalene oxidase repeat protein n=1 Tax=Calycomorphotria hydatis TaxID=2528027 RepID=A0A517TCF9_9PLAN|nr:prenyltransferase/squalene oxidase repeat-containing protein [Calycomorphotria hydatis]QDT66062.1 Prenyltransferase and squalene oxidase repeat protein [Calycomorphotria hydatis]